MAYLPHPHFKGVFSRTRGSTWTANIVVQKKSFSIGLHQTADEAAHMLNRVRYKLGRKVETPLEENEMNELDALASWQDALPKYAHKLMIPVKNKAGYRGVYRASTGRGRWYAQAQINGLKKHLGVFTSKEAAGWAYNQHLLTHGGRVELLNDIDKPPPDFPSTSSEKTSEYRGVSFYRSTNKWRAQIRSDRVSYCLGYFKTEEQAAKAYDKKLIELGGSLDKLNFKPADGTLGHLDTDPDQKL
eukprot:jgi/Botrbrau1/11320/Bobra.0038s0080.1